MNFAIIFDMDGVLVDSHDTIWNSQNAVLGEYGVHLTPTDIKRYCGISMRDCIKDWNQRYSLSLELDSHTAATWAIQKELFKKMHPDPNLVTLLDELKANGVPMGVGTSSQRFRAEYILNALNLTPYFPVLVTANDVQLHKPHPDLFLEVAKRLRIAPERCAVVEDASSGIAAAKAGGMKAIGYLEGHNTAEELRRADQIIRNFSEIDYGQMLRMFR